MPDTHPHSVVYSVCVRPFCATDPKLRNCDSIVIILCNALYLVITGSHFDHCTYVPI